MALTHFIIVELRLWVSFFRLVIFRAHALLSILCLFPYLSRQHLFAHPTWQTSDDNLLPVSFSLHLYGWLMLITFHLTVGAGVPQEVCLCVHSRQITLHTLVLHAYNSGKCFIISGITESYPNMYFRTKYEGSSGMIKLFVMPPLLGIIVEQLFMKWADHSFKFNLKILNFCLN